MPYVTSIERSGMRKMLDSSLRAKFGDEAAEEFIPRIEDINDAGPTTKRCQEPLNNGS